MLSQRPWTNAGMTLIELMVAIAIGLIVLAAILALFVNTLTTNTEALKTMRLDQELRTTLDVIVNDVRRAGYWGDAGGGTLGANNPFMDTTSDDATDIYVLNNGSCVLYSYDANGDGSVDREEFTGFRLTNGIVQMGTGARTGPDQTTDDCTVDYGWSSDTNDVTDPNLTRVTNLTFAINRKCFNVTTGEETGSGGCASLATSPGDITLEVRELSIALDAELAGNSAVRRSLTESVRLRNDRIEKH